MEIVKTSELGEYEGWKDASSGTIVKDLTAGFGDASTSSAGRERWIDADILKKVIQDEQGNVYRIIPMEYKFLVKHGLPLPRKHWLERMKENFRIN